MYRPWPKKKRVATTFVSGVMFNRTQTEVIWGGSSLQTLTFPRTIVQVRDRAFKELERLRVVVLNDGLETLG